MGYFLPFYPPNSPKIQNFEKMKIMPGDVIILNKCTKNYDQVMYSSWDMVRERCNCCSSFWAIFCPFTAQKIKILKKWKNHLEISSFYISVPKIMIRWYLVPEIWCVTDVIVIPHFGLFFALLAQKIKILKKWKKASRYHHFTYVYLKLWSGDVRFLKYGAWQMDRRMDRKSDTKRWVPHLKSVEVKNTWEEPII